MRNVQDGKKVPYLSRDREINCIFRAKLSLRLNEINYQDKVEDWRVPRLLPVRRDQLR